jgi:hypothetical protein
MNIHLISFLHFPAFLSFFMLRGLQVPIITGHETSPAVADMEQAICVK